MEKRLEFYQRKGNHIYWLGSEVFKQSLDTQLKSQILKILINVNKCKLTMQNMKDFFGTQQRFDQLKVMPNNENNDASKAYISADRKAIIMFYSSSQLAIHYLRYAAIITKTKNHIKNYYCDNTDVICMVITPTRMSIDQLIEILSKLGTTTYRFQSNASVPQYQQASISVSTTERLSTSNTSLWKSPSTDTTTRETEPLSYDLTKSPGPTGPQGT